MSDTTLRAAVAALASAGALIAGYLLVERWTGGTIACSTGGCETVQESEYATLAGVPVALLGLFAYAAILVTAIGVTELARAAGAAVALGGVAFSAYLVYVQAALIEAFCQWCLASDAIMALLAVATTLRLSRPQPAGPG